MLFTKHLLSSTLRFLFFSVLMIFGGIAQAQQPTSVGWTAQCPNPLPAPNCNTWSASWPMGSGQYQELALEQGVNYTFENTGQMPNTGTAMSTGWVQAWFAGGTTACSFGSVGSPVNNLLTFNAPTTANYRIAVTSNHPSAPANTCGGGKGADPTFASAVFRYRQNTTITNTTNNAQICTNDTKTLSATLGGTHDNPSVVWSVVSGGGSITGNTYTPAAAGSVTIKAKVGFCSQDVTFNVVQAATAPTSITGDIAICPGNSTTLTATGGLEGVNSVYEWGTGTVPGQNIIAGATGSTYTTPILTNNTSYWVRRVDQGPCTNTTAAATTTVTMNPPILTSENITICADLLPYTWNGITVTAGGNDVATYNTVSQMNCDSIVSLNLIVNPMDNVEENIEICADFLPYTWNGITLNNGGMNIATYSTVNQLNCDSTVSLNLVIHDLPIVDLGNDTFICTGDLIQLEAYNPNATYQWSTSETTSSIWVGGPDHYSVVVTSAEGCTATDQIYVGNMPFALVDGFNFVPAFGETPGKVRFSMVNPQNVSRQEWDFGDGSPVDTNAIVEHIFPATGDYLVRLQVWNDCTGAEVSLPIHVDVTTGIATLIENAVPIVLYPNPTQQILNIKVAEPAVQLQSLVIYNIQGTVIDAYQDLKVNSHQIKTSHLPAGTYTIKIQTNQGVSFKKFQVIQ